MSVARGQEPPTLTLVGGAQFPVSDDDLSFHAQWVDAQDIRAGS